RSGGGAPQHIEAVRPVACDLWRGQAARRRGDGKGNPLWRLDAPSREHRHSASTVRRADRIPPRGKRRLVMKLLNSFGPNPRMVRMFLIEKGINIPMQEHDLLGGENRKP